MNIHIKNICVIIATAATLMAVNLPVQAQPVDVSIGGTALYSWWNPYWNNRKIPQKSPEQAVLRAMFKYQVVDKHAPRYPVIQQFRYGPDASIRFLRNWEIAPSFQYGEASTKGGNFTVNPNSNPPPPNLIPLYRTISMKIKQYNIYSSFGYYF